MKSDFTYKSATIAGVLLVLSACGGGGSGTPGGGGTTNSAPVANAGMDQSVDEQTSVTLNGSASSDPNGDSLTYTWTQAGGVSVTLANTSSAQASFDGPDVGIGSSTTLTFQLRVADPSGATNTNTIDVVVNGVSNSDPVVSAGVNQTVSELVRVTLSGMASDTDIGDSLTYAWTQMSGTDVSIVNSDTANASFDAPAVGAGGETLTFQLAVNDGTATITDLIDVVVNEAQIAVTVSGKALHEFVPPFVVGSQCTGLNFSATETRPIRAATVQLIDANSGNILDTTTAADNGDYSFGNVAGNLDVRLRVRAELKRSGAPSWDVEVRDNIDDPLNPLPLASRPLYVVDSADFNTGGADVTRDFTATTGWDGSAYTGVRAAAPFAILDSIYSAMQMVTGVDPNVTFAPLDAFWSVNNTRTSPTNVDIGELSTSFYRGDIDSLFLLGDANIDTEEFDDHVAIHEWGHYFEDNFSRSDSIGGQHILGESLDLRLAFGEGFAHALAAIALQEQQYCDTGVPGSGTGSFGFSTENSNSGLQGWFNELSVATFIFDLWDTNVDGSDDNSIGFGPIYETMIGPQRTTSAFTTLFSFVGELRPMLNATELAFVDSQLNRENVDTPNVDIWGDGQVSTPSGARNGGRDLTPIYTDIPIGGSTANVCINNDYAVDGVLNKVSDWRYLRFTTPSQGRWTITAQANPLPPPTNDPPPAQGEPAIRDRSDPDLYVWRQDQRVAIGESVADDQEVFTTQTLAADTYVVEMLEFRFIDDGASSDFPSQVCYDVSIVAF